MSLDMQSLIDKLNPTCKTGLEAAAELCGSNTNYSVELEHLLLTLLDSPHSDIQKILRYFNLRSTDVRRELTRSIDRFKRGNSLTPTLSPQIIYLMEQAWLLASIHLNSQVIRSGAVLLAMLDHDVLRGVVLRSSPVLRRVPLDTLKQNLAEIIGAEEKEGVPSDDTRGSVFASITGRNGRKTEALDRFTVDLTAQAEAGRIDPILGREREIRQVIDILTRRRQNNPILTGEAGVGKTAVVEGFALRVARGDVPPSLKNIQLRLLDLGLLQAGAGIKGEFEKRLKTVIEEIKNAARPVILFIDEAHTIIGAGAPPGMGDAANLLKPELARGGIENHCRHHLGGIQEIFRKGPGPGPTFSSGQNRGAR